MRIKPAAFIALVMACIGQASPRAQGQPYQLYEIGFGYIATGMNAAGDVAGYSPELGLFIWNKDEGFVAQDAPSATTPAYTGTFYFQPNPLTIDAGRRVAGTVATTGGMVPGVRAVDGTWTTAANFPHAFGQTGIAASAAINEVGTVVGASTGGDYNTYGPFIWGGENAVQPLPGIDPDPLWTTHGVARDINNVGQVTGYCGGFVCGGATQSAFLWSQAGGLNIIASSSSFENHVGLAVNNHGQVVVSRQRGQNDGSSIWHLLLWSQTLGLVDLQAPTGGGILSADINDAGDIVATFGLVTGGANAYIYRNGEWRLINELVPEGDPFLVDEVVAINNSGMIVGHGRRAGVRAAYLLAPGAPADRTPPVVTVPAPIVAEATSPSGAVVNFDAEANDAVDGSVPVWCDRASGGTFAIGQTMIACSATDASGNTASETFTVTVVDTMAPSLTPPANISVISLDGQGVAVAFPLPVATDAVGVVAIVCAPQPGSVFPLGATTVNCSAADAAGNQATTSFAVNVTYIPMPPVPDPVAGDIDGQGFVVDAGRKIHFKFRVSAGGSRTSDARFLLSVSPNIRGRADAFDATLVSSIVFSDSNAYAPGRPKLPTTDTVTFKGRGRWNGQDHNGFEVIASDRGEPARRDTITIVITDPSGAIVFRAGGQLDGGNIQSHRVR
jgi:hypothetical protein